ncbi:hypothetical protein HanLR1_Chr11g0424791 [Helianthus annuus]|nr:hypothetical protein HanHA89_Chr11g0447461 [Helianthus annuus]KAJ0687323.1 hypothetical protein HanLR1_Chr11g0424791 [Helianthus annuus]
MKWAAKLGPWWSSRFITLLPSFKITLSSRCKAAKSLSKRVVAAHCTNGNITKMSNGLMSMDATNL